MKSMTGFGRGIATTNTLQCTVELKSVNSRYCDLSLKIPRNLNFMEDVLRNEVQNACHRGKIEISILLKEIGDREKEFVVNHQLCQQIKEFLVAEQFYETTEKVPLAAVMSVSKDWVTIEDISLGEEEIKEVVLAALREALVGLDGMREIEGNNISSDLYNRLPVVEDILKHIDEHKSEAVKKYETRLLEKITEALKKTGNEISMDRFYQEVAIMADKTDITEEVVRFASHVVQLKNTFNEEGPIGRKLDFLLQEMNREVNTMGSKGADLAITDRVVLLKSELEKIREQIQNIE